MSEIDLLRRIARKARAAGRGLLLGIGDDCAIFRSRGASEDLLFTTDMMLEDVHFRRGTHPPETVGWKALARGLSDIAAMGGQPRFCLLSLAVPRWAGQDWIDAFYKGFLALARKTSTPLVGGDLARAERMSCDVVVCGAVPPGKALRRDGARPGDGIYVTGPLGGAALGLETHSGAAWKKHSNPEPRLDFGLRLRGRATAAIDLSDGLSLDLHRLCLASRCAAVLDGEIPVFPGATLAQALHGGEDYELLFTARTAVKGAIRIGAIKKGRPGLVEFEGKPLEPSGYDHFTRAI
ncbi:MAG TPA: thiamine-phosphate kinase [Bryobacteraceae bacterium]|nr:thiamine-phosphate kinase [Bryobacteraceae bacterium]